MDEGVCDKGGEVVVGGYRIGFYREWAGFGNWEFKGIFRVVGTGRRELVWAG